MCGHGAPPASEAGLRQERGENDDGDAGEDWNPEACFTAVDVEYGGKVVDLTRNITRGPLEKIPGEDRMWRVPHHVKVCCRWFCRQRRW